MARKDTTATFIEKARRVHGDRFDYSKVDYINCSQKVCIIDKTNNEEFWQLPYVHLQGCGNPDDANEKRKKSLRLSKEEFVEKAKKVHGDKYDYTRSDYVNNKTKVCIICKQCGNAFWQLPVNHLKGVGCPICGHKVTKILSKAERELELKQKDFIEKAKKIHKDENIDYSFVKYVNNRTPVLLYDHDLRPDGEEWGEFWQTPYNHLKGQMHAGKKSLKYREMNRLSAEEIIKRFKEVHLDENLDYSKVVYINMHTKVCIIDHDLRPDGKEWGEYWQEPVVHLKGCGHPEKGAHKQHLSQKYNTDIWIKKAQELYPDGHYDFSLVDYKASQEHIDVICTRIGSNGKPHGVFSISPDNFLQGKGCPKCGNQMSKAEDEIYDFLKNLQPDIIRKEKAILSGRQEVDIYVPSAKLAIEYNGLRWHSEKFCKDYKYHLRKTQECEKQGIHLIHIFEDEWLEHKEIVLSKLKHILGKSEGEKVFARKCTTKEIDRQTAKTFLDANHIQGFALSTIYLGAYYNDELVGVMTFKKEQKNSDKWELTRFATDITKKCVGLGGKMFAYFKENYYLCEVKSFADRRWSTSLGENLYTRMGFELTEVLAPNYRYVMPGSKERHHKFKFRKQRLSKKYNLPLTMTENEMTQALGFYRIWDCGLLKYVYKKR